MALPPKFTLPETNKFVHPRNVTVDNEVFGPDTECGPMREGEELTCIEEEYGHAIVQVEQEEQDTTIQYKT